MTVLRTAFSGIFLFTMALSGWTYIGVPSPVTQQHSTAESAHSKLDDTRPLSATFEGSYLHTYFSKQALKNGRSAYVAAAGDSTIQLHERAGFTLKEADVRVSGYFLGSQRPVTRAIGKPARVTRIAASGRVHTSLAYPSIRFRRIYSGISVDYHVVRESLKSDFILQPGSKVETIRLVFDEGNLGILSNGDAELVVDGTRFVLEKPTAFQRAGEDKESVGIQFTARQNTLGFDVGPYDHSRALYIDPLLRNTRFVGGRRQDTANDVVIDDRGFSYIVGSTTSPGLATSNAIQRRMTGESEVFVMKLSRDGKRIIFATYLGGRRDDYSDAVDTDAEGRVALTGWTFSRNFPTTPGALREEWLPGDTGDAFVARLNKRGTRLIYSTFLGGSDHENGNAIAIGSNDSVVVAGTTASSDFPTKNAFQPTLAGLDDAFVTRLNSTGSQLIFSTYLGGEGFDRVMISS